MLLGQSADDPNVQVPDTMHLCTELREPVWANHGTGQGEKGLFLLKMFFGGQILRGAEPDTFGDAIPAHLRFAVAAGPAKG